MRIDSVTLFPCAQRMRDATWKFARAAVPAIDGHVIGLGDGAGNIGLGYAHAIPAISTHGEGARTALEMLRPMLMGRQFDEIGVLVDEVDRTLAFHHSVKAAIDMALHDLLARRLGVSVATLLGGRRHAEIAQARIVPIKSPTEMAEQALARVQEGYAHLKLKLSGDTRIDIERVASVRAAVGDGVRLTLDPNQSYGAKQMLSAFARMERHDITVIEQPVPAADWAGLALLTRSLPVAIEADESAGSVHDVYRLVTDRVVDVVNLKITKLGGFLRFQQAVHVCEAGGVACRVGAAFGPSLMQAMNAQAASTVKALPYACELAENHQLLDDPFTDIRLERGMLLLPEGSGCGVTFAVPPVNGNITG